MFEYVYGLTVGQRLESHHISSPCERLINLHTNCIMRKKTTDVYICEQHWHRSAVHSLRLTYVVRCLSSTCMIQLVFKNN